ncbi:SET domain-containing protein [Melittangium boletus]|uniref:SET domain-containing protein n=1 Tax=Melittangium boletus TaxID=83453 RepID=UPI003DA399A0
MNNPDFDRIIADNQYHPNVEWRVVPGKGRGVFARKDLRKGALVEWAPISRFPSSDLKHQDHRESQALHHVFTWSDEPGREKAYAWGLLALYNHSDTPNVEFRDGPIPESGAAFALRDIAAGEELCIDYGYTWFKTK